MIRKLAHNKMEHIAGGDIWEIETPHGVSYIIEVNKNAEVPTVEIDGRYFYAGRPIATYQSALVREDLRNGALPTVFGSYNAAVAEHGRLNPELPVKLIRDNTFSEHVNNLLYT